jgi:adenylate kinase family enzyme
MRVIVFGSSGSGKSTLSSKLSQILNINNYDLDTIYWKRKYDLCRNCNDRNKLFKKIVNKKDWIIEGVYTSWTENAVKNCDYVIILNPNKYIVIFRLVKRFIISYFSKNKNRYKSTFRSLFLLIKYAYLYNTNKTTSNYYNHIKIAKLYFKNYYVFKNKKEIRCFLFNLRKH